MNPILAVLKLWTLLKSVPWLWRLVQNWRAFRDLLYAANGMLESARASGGLPTAEAFDAFMVKVEDLLRTGVIDIPEVDEKILADELYQMRKLMVGSVDDGREKRGLNVV